MMVSMALNRTFCGSQPMVLKASVMPTPLSPLLVALRFNASISDVLLALTRRSPPVRTSLLST